MVWADTCSRDSVPGVASKLHTRGRITSRCSCMSSSPYTCSKARPTLSRLQVYANNSQAEMPDLLCPSLQDHAKCLPICGTQLKENHWRQLRM